MSDVLRFMAPGPWLTRDLKECVLASNYDALAARLEAEEASHAITAANLERLQDRWDKRPVVDDLQARLARAEQLLALMLEDDGLGTRDIVREFLGVADSADVKHDCPSCGCDAPKAMPE